MTRLLKRKWTRIASEDGFTLLEAVIASALTAGTLVIILLFTMRSYEVTSEMGTINDINHSFRRVQREFLKDVGMAQYFFFGADTDNKGNQIPKEFIDRRQLTIGYRNLNNETVWVRYAVKVGAETGVYYLLKTSNEVDGGTAYVTSILASDISDLYLTYYDVNDIETTEADRVSRIEMTLVLSDASITEQEIFSATLRGENLGIMLPGVNLAIYEDTNFVK